MRSTAADFRKHPGSTLDCPEWCIFEHDSEAAISMEEWSADRHHVGSQLHVGDMDTIPVAMAEYVRIDDLATGTAGEIRVILIVTDGNERMTIDDAQQVIEMLTEVVERARQAVAA